MVNTIPPVVTLYRQGTVLTIGHFASAISTEYLYNAWRSLLDNTRAPIRKAAHNQPGDMRVTLDDGIKAPWFVPMLVPSANKIIGAVTTDTRLWLVCQYENGAGGEMNKRIFMTWTTVLMNI